MAAVKDVDDGRSALLKALMRPDTYPNRPSGVELRETHISRAFLAGDYVYKIKKPVRFSFVDASTLERRRHLCEEEVRLNRRLAPDVYLGVVPIVVRQGRLTLDETDNKKGEIQEYAVKMRRLKEAGMLDRIVAGHAASVKQIAAIAQRLAVFHHAADDAKGWTYGSAAAVWRLVIGNFREVREECATLASEAEFGELEGFFHSFAETRWSLLNERALKGCVREGHGDLRCEHISLADGQVRIIDCVEFSEALRYVDVASDVAFLAMDLDRLGTFALADALIASYREACGDADLALMMPLYRAHRALVRAKVECLSGRAHESSSARKAAAAQSARDYLALALSYARESAVAMIVVCGMSGSGKSTVARRLADRVGFQVLRSDIVRKRLAGVAATHRLSTDYKAGAYTHEFTERTYSELLGEAAQLLGSGSGVIVDATFNVQARRAAARDVATRAGVPFLFVECAASEPEIIRRLSERERRGDDASDAGVATYMRQRGEFDPLDDVPDKNHVRINTTGSLDSAIETVRQRLRALRAG
jgi:uncharacterized protein